jgi:hypothetical protein
MTTVTTLPTTQMPLTRSWSACPPLASRVRAPRPTPVAVLLFGLLVAPWRRRPRPVHAAARAAVATLAVPATVLWVAVVATLGTIAFLGALVGAAFLGLVADGT